jgi:hypothetical protein
VIPVGSTHVGEFYGRITYYRRIAVQRVSFAIDDIITVVSYFFWENDRWVDVGDGFSPRCLKGL